MKVTSTLILGPKEVEYTWDGENIARMRRGQLFLIAKAFGVADPTLSKNDLLYAIIGKAKAIGAETELTDIAKKAPAKKKKTVTKKVAKKTAKPKDDDG